MPNNSRNADTITFSLPPGTAQHVRRVATEEGHTMSEVLREAIRPYVSTWRNGKGRQRNRYRKVRSREQRNESG